MRGIDERWLSVSPSANSITDMYWDPRGGWSSSGGYRRITIGPTLQGVVTSPFLASGAIESIHWFSQHTGARRWLIYIDGNGNLYAYNYSDGARTASAGDAARDRANNTLTRSVVVTPWQRHQSTCWGDTLYLTNGIDRPLVFNGYWWDYAGWTSPAGTPSAVAMSHPHADDSGATPIPIPNAGIGPITTAADTSYKYARRYRMSFVNDRGQESPLSAVSDLVYFVNTNAGHFARLVIPTGPSSCVARRLYCTQNLYDSSGTLIQGRDTQFFFHSEEQNNITTFIMDGKGDGFLGALVDATQLGEWPTNAKYMAPFKGCMFASGSQNSAVYFSLPGFPEVFPPDNYIDVGDANLGPVTGLYATRNALVVFKRTAIYLIKGDPVNGFFSETLTRETGCAAHNTIREVPSVGLVFLADDAVNALQGALENEGVPTKVINIGVPIPETLRTLNRAAILNSCAAVNHRDKEYWLCIPTTGHAANNLVMVYHYEIGEWSRRTDFPVASILETPDSGGNLLFASWSTSHLGIMVYSRRFPDKDGVAITPEYETGQMSVQGAFRSHRPKTVLLRGILHGDNPLNLDMHSNRSQTSWYTGSVGPTPEPTAIQQYPQEITPVFDTATFDTADIVWQEWRPGVMRWDVENLLVAPILETTMTFTPTAGKRWMTVCFLALEVAVDDPTPWKPLQAGL